MKSGLEGRNNTAPVAALVTVPDSLNEVRPRRPEQSGRILGQEVSVQSLNEVRPRRPEQSALKRRPIGSLVPRLNEVRPRRPEQFSQELWILANLWESQ